MSFMDKARRELQSDDPTARATILWSLAVSESVPDDALSLIERLLNDRAMARMSVPFRYGEVRYIAAETYAKMLFGRGRTEPFVLAKAIAPIELDRLEQMRERAGLNKEGGETGILRTLAELRELGLLEVYDEVFDRRYFDLDE